MWAPNWPRLPGLEPGLARPLSIVEVDQSWSVPVDLGQLRRVAGTGAIPMITWECGDTDANVTAGADDALITRFARELSSLGAPVMVRWFPDANGSSPATQGCLGAGGATGYVAAFQHVSQLLASAGATNAATVWSVDTSQGSSTDWAGLYPGPSSADWIAADDESPTPGPADPGGVSSAFGAWYSTFSTYAKPLLISNTGTAPGSQRQFLTELASSLPTQYPQIKGVVYVDAPGAVTQTPLTLDTDGLAAFRAASDTPYFQPTRSPSSIAIRTSLTQVAQGQQVAIAGTVDAPDLGGSITYLVNGSVVTGCAYLPVTVTAGCNTSTLPVGSDSIVAAYSGDAAFQPSTSAPLSVTVAAVPAPPPTPTTTLSATSPPAGIGSRPSHAQLARSHDPACAVPSPADSSGPGSSRSSRVPARRTSVRRSTRRGAPSRSRPPWPPSTRASAARPPSSSSTRPGTHRSTPLSSSRLMPPGPSPWSPGPAATSTPTSSTATTTPSSAPPRRRWPPPASRSCSSGTRTRARSPMTRANASATQGPPATCRLIATSSASSGQPVPAMWPSSGPSTPTTARPRHGAPCIRATPSSTGSPPTGSTGRPLPRRQVWSRTGSAPGTRPSHLPASRS